MHYILESTFARIFLFLELILQQETHIYNNLHQFALFLSLFHNNVILIGHSKQCVHSRRTRGVLKIERYEQSLTYRACMGEASSYSWAPVTSHHHVLELHTTANTLFDILSHSYGQNVP